MTSSSAAPGGGGPGEAERLDALTTEELRTRAVDLAKERKDVGFLWDLVKHMPASVDTADGDASAGGTFETLQGAVELMRELRSGDFGDREPLLRARFIDYLSSPPG